MFDFIPKVVMYMGYLTSSGSYVSISPQTNYSTFMFGQLLTTSFTNSHGFNNYSTYASNGKKSEDGKTFYWWNQNSPDSQCNSKGYTYYFLAIT